VDVLVRGGLGSPLRPAGIDTGASISPGFSKLAGTDPNLESGGPELTVSTVGNWSRLRASFRTVGSTAEVSAGLS
jgi:hypothetical protein